MPWKRRCDISLKELNRELFVFNRETSEVHTFNRVASEIFKNIEIVGSSEELVDILSDIFDVSRDELSSDVEEFLSVLSAKGLIEEI